MMDEDDERSVTCSDISDVSKPGKHRRRSTVPKIHYTFAYPPQTQLSKQRLIQIRPKQLLQLQVVPVGSRPMPCMDVLPSTQFLPRVFKKYPRMFRGKAKLGANDVMIVRSENYDAAEDDLNAEDDSEDESLANRELLAVICQAHKDAGGDTGKAEIVLADGTSWIASPSGDNFEFVHEDEHGLRTMARWRRKPPTIKKAEGLIIGEGGQDFEYQFSIIDPSSRRHPILATLSRNNLRVYEYYLPINPSPELSAPPSPIRRLSQRSNDLHEHNRIVVDAALRMFIQISAMWTGLSQDWCPYFTYNIAPPSSIRSRVTSGLLTLALPQPSHSSPTSRAGTPEPVRSPLLGVSEKVRRSLTVGSKPPLANPPGQLPATQRNVSTGSAFMQKSVTKRGHSFHSEVNGSVEESLFESRGAVVSNDDSEEKAPLRNTLGNGTKVRPQSMMIFPSNGHHKQTSFQEQERGGPLITEKVDVFKKAKTSRWKTFTGIFKKSSSRMRDS